MNDEVRILDKEGRVYILCSVDFPATLEGKILTAAVEYINKLRGITKEVK